MALAELEPVNADEEYRFLIGGDWVAPEGGTYEIVDPNTTRVIGHAPEASMAQVADAAAAAKAALPGWRDAPMAERCALLGRAADLIDERIGGLTGLVQGETGATINITEAVQLPACGERFRQYQFPVDLDENMAPYPVEANPLGPGGLAGAHVIRQPVGVVACITSYNFPLVNVSGKVAPALAMGNTVVIKPAPQDPLAMIKAVEIIEEAGFPPGVVNIVTGSGAAAGAALVESPDVNMVSFTGSTAVGVKIMEAGAATMKRLLMELGGKGACVLTDDCDVDAALGAIASVWGLHSGQICTAPTRVIVHRSRYDELVDKLTAVAGMLTVGNALDRDTLVGPVITEAHRDRVEGYIASGSADGATVQAGGERPDLPGYFVAPTSAGGLHPRHAGGAGGDLRPGGGRADPRRRRPRRGAGQQQRLRPVQLRVRRQHRPRLRGRPAHRIRQRRPQLPSPPRQRPLRRLQDERHRPRPRCLRPPRL